MHVLIAGLYGVTFWLATLAAAIMLRGNWVAVLIMGPVIITGAMAFLWAADWAVWRLWAWASRTAHRVRSIN